MFTHQQTEACTATATRRPGQAEKREAGGALVVLVTNYHSHTSLSAQPTHSHPQHSEEEVVEEVEEEVEEVPDEKDLALAEALRVVVSGWLQEENDLNYNTVKLQRPAASPVTVSQVS